MSAKACSQCGKSAGSGNSRSHSNIATGRKFYPNVQTKKINGKRVRACTTCIKTLAK